MSWTPYSSSHSIALQKPHIHEEFDLPPRNEVVKSAPSQHLQPSHTRPPSTQPPSYSEIGFSPVSPSVYNEGFRETALHGNPPTQPASPTPARYSQGVPLQTMYRQQEGGEDPRNLEVPKQSHSRALRAPHSVNTSVSSFQSQDDPRLQKTQVLPAPVTTPAKRGRSGKRQCCCILLIASIVLIIAIVLAVVLGVIGHVNGW